MFFKNAIVYECSNPEVLNKINNKLLQNIIFKHNLLDNSTCGFVSPVDNSEVLMLNVQGQILLKYKIEQKVLPPAVIKQTLLEKIDKQEKLFKRKLTKCEKATLKDEVLIDLLPRAFSKYDHYWLWVDTKNKRIIIESSNFKLAENILSLLRKELGILALSPLSLDAPLEQMMTKWVKENLSFPPLALGDQVELKDLHDDVNSSIINCKNQEITSDEIRVHFDFGKWVTKLKICDERGVSYVLNKNFIFKQIRFDLDIVDENDEDKTERLIANFFLISKILSNSINDIKQVFEKIK